MKLNRTLPGLAVLLLAAAPASAAPPTRTVEVNCAAGGRLADAITLPAEKLTVRFRGTCNERITISRDDFTLRGADPGATVVGSVTVHGGARVLLTGFTVRDTPGDNPFTPEGDAVRVIASQNVTLERLKVQDTGRRGISIEESAADLIDDTVLRAGGAGVQALASQVNVFGNLTITDGATPGLLLSGVAHLFLRRDARLATHRNAIGIVIQGNSAMMLSNETSVHVFDNAFIGFLVTSQADLLYGEVEVVVRGNGLGVLVSEYANWTPFVGSPAEIRIRDNPGGGVLLERGGFMELGDGTAVVTGNGGPGFSIDDSRLVLAGTTARGNAGGDVLLFARTSAIFNERNSFGTPIACDDSVLVRGTASCGRPLPAAAAVKAAGTGGLPELLRKARSLLGENPVHP